MPQKLAPYHKIMEKQTRLKTNILYRGFLFTQAQVSTQDKAHSLFRCRECCCLTAEIALRGSLRPVLNLDILQASAPPSVQTVTK